MAAKRHTAVLSLGSNLGDRAGWLRQAAHAVAELPDTEITARSSLYATEPVDVPAEFKCLPFLNGVLIIETGLTSQQLSDAVHQIERELQRTWAVPNQPRTIDIDIITFDTLICNRIELTLPHPRAHIRRFVLQPLTEIAPALTLPDQSASVAELLARLPQTPSVLTSEEPW
jgi:2-amino-4-hydroxy-6-hydroxymethyldihydropteridine diphosphokinase